MHILIYGAGALGQALGCMLAADGHRVTLVIRKRFIDTINRGGLHVGGIFGDYHIEAGRLSLTDSITGADGSSFGAILITTKSYDTAAAVSDLATLTDCSCPVVSMQNGCGNVELVEAAFGIDRGFGARVITGFEIVEPGHVTISVSADDIHIGSCRPGVIPEDAARIAGVIGASGLPCRAVKDVHQSLFAKLLYNTALNPLGAILGVNYGRLSESEGTMRIMNAVIAETFHVITAAGADLPWETAEQYQEFFYRALLPATYDHRPSMLQDLEHGKPTEIDAFAGYVSKSGKKHGIATPHCDMLAELIRFKEQEGPSALALKN